MLRSRDSVLEISERSESEIWERSELESESVF